MIIITTPREKKKPENGFDLLFHSSKYQKKNEEAFYLSGIAQNFTCTDKTTFLFYFSFGGKIVFLVRREKR